MSKVFWTPEQLRIQARLEPEDGSLDTQLELYAKAAVTAIESHTNRVLFPSAEALPADAPENALPATDNIVLAILMMVAHWFDNPGPVNIGNITSEIPLGFQFLVDPYRWFSL